MIFKSALPLNKNRRKTSMWKSEREDINLYSEGEVDKWVYTTCNICSLGCGGYIAVKDGQVVGIKGNKNHPVNRGRLGPKGENQWYANRSPDRLRTPLVRNEEGELVPTDWESAMNLLVSKTKENISKYGPDSFAFYSTGQLYTEDYYTLSKIGRAGIKTHNMDANTRLCTATTQFGLMLSFGADGAPASFEDIDQTDCLVLVGHNPAETGTVLFERIMHQREKRGGYPKLIVVDPRKTLTAQAADLHLPLEPGSNVPLLNGILYQLITEGKVDIDFINQHTVGYDKMKKEAMKYDPETAAKMTRLSKEQIIEAANMIGDASKLVMTTLQGVYQANNATASTVAVNNIHLVLGQIGRPGCGPLHTAGQPSSSSNRAVGGAGAYPAQRNPDNPDHIQEVADLWNVPADELPVGMMKSIEEMVDDLEDDSLKMMWIIATNPMVSLPNRYRARKAMEKSFVVVQDIFLNETADVADLVLPAAMWAEKEGTMENAERRVNLLRKAVEPPEGVQTDFDILVDFARRMDFRDQDGNPLIGYSTPKEAFEEWKRVSEGRPCDMTEATYDKLEEYGGMQWPISKEHPEGTPRLYEDLHFHTEADDANTYGYHMDTGEAQTKEEWEAIKANGRAILYPIFHDNPPEEPDTNYPFWLLSGRNVYQWHTRTKTARSPILHAAAPHAYVEMNQKDAEEFHIIPGERVRLISPRGKITVPVRITDTMQRGSVFVPMHYGRWEQDESANTLTIDNIDPISKQPVFKSTACRVELLRTRRVVEEGENLADLAEQYALDKEEIAYVNRMTPPYLVNQGSEVLIPSAGDFVLSPPELPFRDIDHTPMFEQKSHSISHPWKHHTGGEGLTTERYNQKK